MPLRENSDSFGVVDNPIKIASNNVTLKFLRILFKSFVDILETPVCLKVFLSRAEYNVPLVSQLLRSGGEGREIEILDAPHLTC
jgi:hypothetical protein